MRAQHERIVDVKRILHIACGMVLRDVEQLEIVKVALDFWTFRHFEPHSEENFHDVLAHTGDGMQRPPLPALRGQRHVYGLGGKPRRFLPLRDFRRLAFQRGLDFAARNVQYLAHFGTLFLGKRAEPLHKRGHLPALAEKTHSDVVELGGSRSGFHRGKRRVPDAVDLCFHINSVQACAYMRTNIT